LPNASARRDVVAQLTRLLDARGVVLQAAMAMYELRVTLDPRSEL